MNMNEYQQQASQYATYQSINYPYFALVEEVGEFYGKIAKTLRGDVVPELDAALKKELGDILWNLSEICSLRGYSLAEIAQGNLDKLASRKERGVIQGDGDDR